MNRSTWICSGKVLPPQSEYPREVAERPQMTALGKSSCDWKRAVSHIAEGSGCVEMSLPRARHSLERNPVKKLHLIWTNASIKEIKRFSVAHVPVENTDVH